MFCILSAYFVRSWDLHLFAHNSHFDASLHPTKLFTEVTNTLWPNGFVQFQIHIFLTAAAFCLQVQIKKTNIPGISARTKSAFHFEHNHKVTLSVPYLCIILLGVSSSQNPWLQAPRVSFYSRVISRLVCWSAGIPLPIHICGLHNREWYTELFFFCFVCSNCGKHLFISF